MSDEVPLEAPTQPRKHVRLGSASAFAFSAQMFSLATGFIASVLIARALGPASKGQLSVLQQVAGLLAVLLNLGTGTANTYFVGKGKHQVGEVLGNSLFIAALAGVVGLPVVLLFTVGPAAVVEGIPLAGALMAAVYLPITLASGFVSGVNIAVGEMKALSRTQMAGASISVTVVVAAFLTGNLTVPAAMFATALNAMIALTLNGSRLARHYTTRVRVHLSYLRESARYSAKAYLVNLAGYLNYRADIIIVGYLSGARTVGIYSIAVTFAELMWHAPNALSSALLSKVMQSDDTSGDAVTARSARLVSVLMLVICLIAAVLISPIIMLFYGDLFLPAVTPFLFLLPGVWAIGLARVLSPSLAARGILLPGVAAVTTTMNLIALFLLVPSLGASGAALASTLTYGTGSLVTMSLYARHTGARPRDWLLPTRADWRAIAGAIRSYASARRARRGTPAP